jgi:hypothetical protein
MELRDFLGGRHKLVVRLKDGRVLRGNLSAATLTRGQLSMTTVAGEAFTVDVEKLKAVFFVRTYEGDKGYFENKLLESDPERHGLRVRVRFDDDETMEGVAENSIDLLQGPGFFLWPADGGANNQLIYVVKSALLGFKVIGIKT